MPKLFPAIDAVPLWLAYLIGAWVLSCVISGAIWWLWFLREMTSWARWEWKQWRWRAKEAAIAAERMQAAAERGRR